MKRKFAFLFAVMMMLTTTACSNDDKNSQQDNLDKHDSSSSVQSDSLQDNTQIPSNPTVENENNEQNNITSSQNSQEQNTLEQQEEQTPSSEVTKPQEPVSKPTETPKPQEPVSKPAETPKPEQTQEISISDISAAIDKAIGVDDGFMSLSESDISSSYGIDASSMSSYAGKMPLINVKATEYLVVKAASGKVETVKNGMKKRQADLDAQWKQYLPEQYELVKNYKLVSNGDYVLFVISENADAAVDAFNSMTKN